MPLFSTAPTISPLNISPFIDRELKLALRQHRGGYRHIAAFTLAALAIFFLLLTHLFDIAPHKAGAPLFSSLVIYCILEAVLIGDDAAQLFPEDQRINLALLFGTGISPREVFFGKFIAIFIAPLSRLLTVVPCLFIVIMMKAATPQVCALLLVTALVLMAFNSSLNLLSSLLFKERAAAAIGAYSGLALLLGFFPFLNLLNRSFGFGGIDRFWLSLNPATAPWILFDSPRNDTELYYVSLSLLFSALLAILFFSATVFLLGTIWQDQVSGVQPLPFSRFLASFRNWQCRRVRHVLEVNPYLWLIQRDQRPALLTWSIFVALALIWLAGLAYWRGAWLIPLNFWVTLVLLGLIVRAMTEYLGARQIGLDRFNGSLELLITSPLTVADIVAAQHAAIRNYIRPLYIFLAALHLLFFLLGLLFFAIPPGALTNYILISALVALFGPWLNFQGYWVAFWISLNTGRPLFALTKNLWQGTNRFSFFWIFILVFKIDRLPSAPTGSLGETIVVGAIIVAFLLWYIFYLTCWTTDWNRSQKTRNLILAHLHNIAAHPIPDINDDHVKSWDPSKPLFNNHEDALDLSDPELRDERSRQRILQR
jgi:hypothetical protein